MTYPLGLPQELGITGRVFTDFGSLFDIHRRPRRAVDRLASRCASRSGVGVSWKSPLGPINLDLGVPVVRKPYDQLGTRPCQLRHEVLDAWPRDACGAALRGSSPLFGLALVRGVRPHGAAGAARAGRSSSST